MAQHIDTAGTETQGIAELLASIQLDESDWIIDGAFDTVMTPPEAAGDFDESATWIEMH